VLQPLERLARLQARAVQQEQHGDRDFGGGFDGLTRVAAGRKQHTDDHRGEQPEQKAVDAELGEQIHRTNVLLPQLTFPGDRSDISNRIL